MGKVEFNIQSYITPPYSQTFCPFQSSGSVPVYCDKECALFCVQRVSDVVVFAGCSLKWGNSLRFGRA